LSGGWVGLMFQPWVNPPSHWWSKKKKNKKKKKKKKKIKDILLK
jgi:hypothetical protein